MSRTERSDRERVSLPKKLVFSTIMVVLALCGAEWIIRITGVADHCDVPYKNPRRVCDPIFNFKNNPAMKIHGEHLNRAGFRTHEFTPKSPDVYRIVSLGDSCTIGVFTDIKRFGYVRAPYPARLEQLISERVVSPRVEVFNVGVGGYNSFHGLMLLRSKLRGLDPDLITVRFGWNDHFMSPLGRKERAFSEPENPLALALQSVLLRTHLYPFFRRIALESRAGAHSARRPPLPTEWIPDVSMEQYEGILRRITEVASGQGAEVWFLTAPDAFVTDEYRGRYEEYARNSTARKILIFNALSSFERFTEIHAAYNQATRRMGQQLGIHVVDMTAIYEQNADQHLFSPVDAMHPLQAGHDLEAEALFEELVARGVIGKNSVGSRN